jgi:hypothetical protein
MHGVVAIQMRRKRLGKDLLFIFTASATAAWNEKPIAGTGGAAVAGVKLGTCIVIR